MGNVLDQLGGGVVLQLRDDPTLMSVDGCGVVLVRERDDGLPFGSCEGHGMDSFEVVG